MELPESPIAAAAPEAYASIVGTSIMIGWIRNATRTSFTSRPVILMPEVLRGPPRHEPDDEDGDDDVHDHVHQADALSAGCRLDQHPHEAPEDHQWVHRGRARC